jgi:hypothetical protein
LGFRDKAEAVEHSVFIRENQACHQPAATWKNPDLATSNNLAINTTGKATFSRSISSYLAVTGAFSRRRRPPF